jgi:hypothetical protein
MGIMELLEALAKVMLFGFVTTAVLAFIAFAIADPRPPRSHT